MFREKLRRAKKQRREKYVTLTRKDFFRQVFSLLEKPCWKLEKNYMMPVIL